MTVLGIDIGSTFIKSSILDLKTMSVQNASSTPTPDFIDKSGYEREISIETVAAQIKKVIDDAVLSHAIGGILFSVQMHGFMLFGPENTPLTNYISWQDMRAGLGEDGEDTAALLRQTLPEELFIQNGVILKNTHSLCPLYCYNRQRPLAGPVQFAMMGDAVIRLLTGTVPPVHSTVAASSGLYSLTAKDWNRDLIDALGLDGITFPPVYDGREPAAFYSTDAHSSIPIYTAVGDHQAAVLGTCTEDDYTVINIGTGGQICYLDKQLHFGGYETRPFFRGRTLRALTQLPSGRSLRVLTDFMMEIGQQLFDATQTTEPEVWRAIDRLTEQAEAAAQQGGHSLRVNLSFFNHAAPDSGSVTSIDSNNLTVGNLIYGAYHYMAEEYYSAFQRLLSDAIGQVKGVVYTGGVLRKTPLLQRLMQKRFGLPCQTAAATEDTMAGLLRLALWYSGNDDAFEIPLCLEQ